MAEVAELLKGLSAEEILRALAEKQESEKAAQRAEEIAQLEEELARAKEALAEAKARVAARAAVVRDLSSKLASLRADENALAARVQRAMATLTGQKPAPAPRASRGEGSIVRYNAYRLTVNGQPRSGRLDSFAWSLYPTTGGLRKLQEAAVAQTGIRLGSDAHKQAGTISFTAVGENGKTYEISVGYFPNRE